jgi:glycosyltransferase involved in cell wall biosynthesis
MTFPSRAYRCGASQAGGGQAFMPPQAGPRFSVVIPAYNEEANIAACLSSLAEQDYPGPVEVIVVDNASTDATAQIARDHGARVINEPERGVCHARQRGTSAARGAIVISSDADTTYPRTWLSQIDAVLSARPDLVATCGPCAFVDGPWWSGPYTKVLFGFTGWVYRRKKRVLYATATNIAFRRSAWSGYDTSLTQGGDELDLLRRLRRRGKIHFDSARTTLTSSRRLHRGLFYNAFVTCLYFYFFAYYVNRLAGRPLVGAAPAIRPAATSSGPRRQWHPRAVAALAVGLAMTWWLTPLDVV